MALLSYASDIFMPLFCSSRASVVILNLLNVITIYCLVYWSSDLLQSRYNVPDIFAPNSQDYFRTSLLGLLSPFLLYFIKNFLCNFRSRYLALNLLIEYTLNDWFMLLIIFSLAYPQLQDAPPNDSWLSAFFNEGSSSVWHIIPKQCYIFGISWSFSEVLISVMESLYSYEEISSASDNDYAINSNQAIGENPNAIRTEIDLDRCISIRRNRSQISKNVYNPGYGTTSGGNNMDSNSEESTMVVNFNTDSMNFLKDVESHGVDLEGQGLHGRSGSYSFYQSPQHQAKLFHRINSWKRLVGKITLSNLIHIDYIIGNIGQALLMSIYFIYVPSHPSLFTKTVIYFGSKTFTHFLICVICPFFTLHVLYHIFLYTWKDHDTFDDSATARPQTRKSQYSFESVKSPLLFEQPSNNLTFIASSSADNILLYNSLNPQDNNFQTDDGKLLLISRTLITWWQSLASHQWFIPLGLTIWSLTIFVLGVLATIKF